MTAIRYSSKHLKVINLLTICGFIALTLTHIDANAIGIGFYATGVASGNTTWDTNYYSSLKNTNIDRRELGFVLDTAVAKDKVFNYRLQIGTVDVSYGNVVGSNISGNYKGTVITNTFGFGIVRTQDFRIWLGPQIGWRNGDMVGLEYGPVLGMNFHISNEISLTAEAGIKNSFVVAKNSNSSSYNIASKEELNFINLGMLWRFGDKY